MVSAYILNNDVSVYTMTANVRYAPISHCVTVVHTWVRNFSKIVIGSVFFII